jgi:2-haloalkanoic acid dehalogenase type II
MPLRGNRPDWVTFDCYGTLIQWDEGLAGAVENILARKKAGHIDPHRLNAVYDRYEHELEQASPHRSFREVAGLALDRAMREFGLTPDDGDIGLLTGSISAMPPFPEVVAALGALKRAGFSLAIISNTDDAIIAGNVRQLGGHIDRVITAEQAQAYKPSRRIFDHAFKALDVAQDDVQHVCASPHLDLAAAREIGLRAVWIDRGTGRQPPAAYQPDATLPTLDGLPGLFAQAGWI